MKSYDVVVVGAGSGGIMAAITARRFYPDKSILVIRKDPLVTIPCGIPYIYGTYGTPEKDLVPIDRSFERNRLEGLVDKVLHIDRSQHIVTTYNNEKIGYQKLVLATGAEPLIPPLPGVEMQNIFTIRKTVPYLYYLLDAMNQAQSLCIVGCGYIGVEFAEESRKGRPNLAITVVEMVDHCLQQAYDEEISVKVEEALVGMNINLMLGARVEAFLGEGKVEKVRLVSGAEIDADMVILGLGVQPEIELARETGLMVGPTKAIQVDRYMRTSDPDIFACGDCAEKLSFFDESPANVRLASVASLEGRIAGSNLFKQNRVHVGTIGVVSTVVGGTAFASAGLTEAQARAKGYDVVVADAGSINRHPRAMPGVGKIVVKLVFDRKNMTVLGGQVWGAESGGEIINIIIGCILHQMTAEDIATYQIGTHPALTAWAAVYPLFEAAEIALQKQQELSSGEALLD